MVGISRQAIIITITIIFRLSNARSNVPPPFPPSDSKILHNLIIVHIASGGDGDDYCHSGDSNVDDGDGDDCDCGGDGDVGDGVTHNRAGLSYLSPTPLQS